MISKPLKAEKAKELLGNFLQTEAVNETLSSIPDLEPMTGPVIAQELTDLVKLKDYYQLRAWYNIYKILRAVLAILE